MSAGAKLGPSQCKPIYMIHSKCWTLIAKDHPAATLRQLGPAAVVSGWEKPKEHSTRPYNRKLRMRSGRIPRLTTKVPR